MNVRTRWIPRFRDVLALAAAVAAATATCAHGPPASTRASPLANSADAGQEALVVIARWPDGLPACGIRIFLVGRNASGGEEPIDTWPTDEEGRVALRVHGGSGRAEVRADADARPGRMEIDLPHPGPDEFVLPPPHEVVAIVNAEEGTPLEGIGFRGERSGDGIDDVASSPFRHAAPGRFVWRCLLARPVRIDVSSGGNAAVRWRWGPRLEDGTIATIVPPAELHFEAARRRRATGRIVAADGRPVVLPGLLCRFSAGPESEHVEPDVAEGGVDGRFRRLEPEEWTRNGPPEGAFFELRSCDRPIGPDLVRTIPWPASGDVDLGDLVVTLAPGMEDMIGAEVRLTVVDDFGRPLSGAKLLAGDVEAGRADAAGRISFPDDGITRSVQAPGHVPVDPDAFDRDRDRTVVLKRTARVEVSGVAGLDPRSAPCLHGGRRPGEPIESRGCGTNIVRARPTRRDPDLWVFDGLEPTSFLVGFEDGTVLSPAIEPWLVPGESRRVAIPDPPPAPLEGRVLDEQGRPVSFAAVSLRPSGPGSASIQRRTRADGSFRFGAFRPDAQAVLEVQAAGHSSAVRKGVEVGAPEPIRLATHRSGHHGW